MVYALDAGTQLSIDMQRLWAARKRGDWTDATDIFLQFMRSIPEIRLAAVAYAEPTVEKFATNYTDRWYFPGDDERLARRQAHLFLLGSILYADATGKKLVRIPFGAEDQPEDKIDVAHALARTVIGLPPPPQENLGLNIGMRRDAQKITFGRPRNDVQFDVERESFTYSAWLSSSPRRE